MTTVIEQAVGAFDHLKATLFQHRADNRRIMDGFPDIFLELKAILFIDPNLQIHLLRIRSCHLEPDPGGFGEIHLKGLAGGHFPFIEDVKNEITPCPGIITDIAENGFQIRH